MLPSLRPLIAEGMIALGERGYVPYFGAIAGVATLRWCDEREDLTNDAQCQADEDLLDTYDTAMTKIDEALDAWMLAKLKRPAEFRDELRKILDDVPR